MELVPASDVLPVSNQRVFAVGCVDGCVDELRDLLDKIAFVPGQDRVVVVGGLIAPNPGLGVDALRLAQGLGLELVLGRREYNLLLSWDSCKAFWSKGGRRFTYDAFDRVWLAACPQVMRVPSPIWENGALLVGGGLEPGIPLNAQFQDRISTLHWVRKNTGIVHAGDLSTGVLCQPDPEHNYCFWAEYPEPVWKDTCVFGRGYFGPHPSGTGHLHMFPCGVSLDTGARQGDRLSAWELGSGQLFSVFARKAYALTTTLKRTITAA